MIYLQLQNIEIAYQMALIQSTVDGEHSAIISLRYHEFWRDH